MHKQENFNKINILGGDSIFTLKSNKTGVCFSYMVQKVKKERSDKPASKFTNTYTVKISLDGDKYYYAGCIRHDTCIDLFKFITNKESYFNDGDKCVQALLWVLKNINSGGITFYNHGKCSVCYGELNSTEDKLLGYHIACYQRGKDIVTGVTR